MQTQQCAHGRQANATGVRKGSAIRSHPNYCAMSDGRLQRLFAGVRFGHVTFGSVHVRSCFERAMHVDHAQSQQRRWINKRYWEAICACTIQASSMQLDYSSSKSCSGTTACIPRKPRAMYSSSIGCCKVGSDRHSCS